MGSSPPGRGNSVVSPNKFPVFKKLTDEDAALGLNMTVFGPPGAGKTTFLMSAQGTEQGGNVLLHDVDKGRESVLDIEDADFYTPETFKELRGNLDIAMELKEDSPYKTHVFDSLSTIYSELIFPMIQDENPKVRDARQWYFDAQKVLVNFVRDSKSLAQYGINTLFAGHVLEDKELDEKGNVTSTTVRLALPEGVRNQVLLSINHVGYLTRNRRELQKRELYLEPPNRRVDGPKIRKTKSSGVVPAVIENPTMDDVFAFIKKGN